MSSSAYPLLKSFGEINFRVFDAIDGIVVDSSKLQRRLLALYAARPKSVFAIFLVRDYRAVTHSKMKRGATLEQGAREWVKRLDEMKVAARIVPKYMWIRYEDLCTKTELVMRDLCSAIGIDFTPLVLERSTDNHFLGGSPSRSGNRKVVLDHGYKDAFSSEQTRIMDRIAGNRL